MKTFEFVRARTTSEAATLLGTKRDEVKLLAGGTDLLGEMKDYLVTPSRLINLKTVPNLGKIEQGKDGVKIGALVTLAQIADSPDLQKQYPVLIQAIQVAAMPQIRNAATIAGNLCQRPRCWYYRDEHTHCLKKGGAKCYALEGENQYHAILGGGPCYIVHPSDPAPALVALNASVLVTDGTKERQIPLDQFFVTPQQNPLRENVLAQNEIITHVLIPPPPPGSTSAYVKEREKDSYDWALASAAVNVTRTDGKISVARIVLGGVAPIPWRARVAEMALIGMPFTDATIREAARLAVADAAPLAKNGYKVPLTEAVVRRAIAAATK